MKAQSLLYSIGILLIPCAAHFTYAAASSSGTPFDLTPVTDVTPLWSTQRTHQIAMLDRGKKFALVDNLDRRDCVRFFDAHNGTESFVESTIHRKYSGLTTTHIYRKYSGLTTTQKKELDILRCAKALNPVYKECEFTHIAVSGDNRYVTVASQERVKLFDLNRPDAEAGPQGFFDNALGVNDELIFTQDNKHLISTSSSGVLKKDGSLRAAAFYIHALGGGRIKSSTRIKDKIKFAGQRRAAAHPTRNQFAVSSGNKITIHNIRGKILRTIRSGIYDKITSLKYSPDGTALVSSGADCNVHLWDTETGTCKQNFKAGTRFVHNSAISPDGKIVVSTTVKDYEPNIRFRTVRHSNAYF